MDESEKILRRHGFTIDSFENNFIKPLKKSGTIEIISNTRKNKDLEWLIDTAFSYFDMHIGARYLGDLQWQLFVEEPSLAEIYFG